jgi:colanic acid biosynthesis protein WcaH
LVPGPMDRSPRSQYDGYIPTPEYGKIMRALPILCVDLVLKQGRMYLLVKRRRSPARGRWWVPGGRVLRGETIEEAAKRKAREELGIEIEVCRELGVYEHFHRLRHRNGKHTVSVVILGRPKSFNVRLDYQSAGWKLSKKLPNSFKITRFRPSLD